MKIGIVGKPSCGKSTFFKAATLVDVAIAAYPFTTISPNFGVSYVRVKCVESEFNVRCNPRQGYCEKGVRYVPVELVDVAGLVPGAHEGKGLGNQFLNDLNMADVLIHVVDASGSANERGEIGAPGSYDPANDVRFLENELDMWYFSVLKKGWEKFAKKAANMKTSVQEQLAQQMSAFNVKSFMVEEAMKILALPENPAHWTDEQLKELAINLRRVTKPILIACNKIDLPKAGENYERLKKEFPEYYFTPCSAASELALREAAKRGVIKYNSGDSDFEIINKNAMTPEQSKGLEFIRESILKKYGSTGVQATLDAAVFDFLKYIAVFPGGVNKLADSQGRVLPDVFLMPPGTTAYDFAARIHTDFAKNFLYAVDVRSKMKIKREHALKNRDVIEIISAAK
ncbi:MAG: redox-regulated ATPase YchF [archaeon]